MRDRNRFVWVSSSSDPRIKPDHMRTIIRKHVMRDIGKARRKSERKSVPKVRDREVADLRPGICSDTSPINHNSDEPQSVVPSWIPVNNSSLLPLSSRSLPAPTPVILAYCTN